MNVKKIGAFLAQLRKEKGLTQEQLGESLGVTNKTVSRWENGNYLPPVEMLQVLSGFYDISINEILSGQRLAETDYKEKAEENIKTALQSSFSVKEKIEYFKTKWKQDHRGSLIAVLAVCVFLLIIGSLQDSMQLVLLTVLLGFGYLITRNNAMMIYVERHAFDQPAGETDTEQSSLDTKAILIRRVRFTALLLLALALWICADMTVNYFSSFVPELNDGVTVRTFWGSLFFGSDGYNWSLLNYFEGFRISLKLLAGVGIFNIGIACLGLNHLKE